VINEGLPRVLGAAINHHHELLVATSAQIAQANRNCVAAFLPVTHWQEINFITHFNNPST
jgi:hypothetical protein